MKQVLQNLRKGDVTVEDVPPPALRGPGVLVATACSLISPGTERATVELGRSSLLGKALRRPDQVRKVLDNLRREGFWQTYNKVQQRLDVTRPLGYSCSGIVLETSRAAHVRPGDRVACAGTDAATHAEINFVPRNLCVPIPDAVGFEEAAFAALGAIAMHAMRLGGSTLSETAAVAGLGPVGLLLAQVLRAAGCRVAGFDLREDRLDLARSLGIERVARADAATLHDTLAAWNLRGGFDCVYIAAASRSTEPVQWSVAAARDRGRIVVVGDVPTDFSRAACYAKELSIAYARSYGPGRYDPSYEERGVDYPRAYVPWTAGRNLEAFLDLVARGQVNVAPLVSHRFPIEQAGSAYAVVTGNEPSLGVLLTYPVAARKPEPTLTLKPLPRRSEGAIGIGVIGAGSYATSSLLPAIAVHRGARLVSVATTRGASARKAADHFGFSKCTTEPGEILADPEIDAVFIATRHDAHAALAVAAIEAGKAVFIEKPLCLSEEELDRITATYEMRPVPLMLGHNRRFAPATAAVREFLKQAGAPVNIQYTVHAGPLPDGHWLSDPQQGGRILGEVCHFVDWCVALAAAPVVKAFAVMDGAFPDQNLHAVLEFAGGSAASILYLTGSSPALPKETIQISAAGCTAVVEDFARVAFHSPSSHRSTSFRGKGQAEMVKQFLDAVSSQSAPAGIEARQWFASARITLKLLESASTGLPVWFDSPQ